MRCRSSNFSSTFLTETPRPNSSVIVLRHRVMRTSCDITKRSRRLHQNLWIPNKKHDFDANFVKNWSKIATDFCLIRQFSQTGWRWFFWSPIPSWPKFPLPHDLKQDFGFWSEFCWKMIKNRRWKSKIKLWILFFLRPHIPVYIQEEWMKSSSRLNLFFDDKIISNKKIGISTRNIFTIWRTKCKIVEKRSAFQPIVAYKTQNCRKTRSLATNFCTNLSKSAQRSNQFLHFRKLDSEWK